MLSIQNIFNPMLRRLISALTVACVCFVAVSGNPAQAQSTLNIAAVVNDEVISVYDLSQRILLVISFSNLPNNPQTQQRIAPDVLKRLIIEKLRLQEAKRLEIEVPDEAIQKSISDIEAERGIPPGQMTAVLEQRGIDPQTLRQQLRAEIAWVEVVRSLFRRLVNISEQEIDDELAKIRADAGKTEYLLAEIFLAYDGKPRAEVMEFAHRLHSQIKGGAGWQQLAQNFSESVTARDGGDMGWNLATELPQPLDTVIQNLNVDEMSQPIATDEGIYLMLLRDKRVAKGIEAEPGDITVGIYQLHLAIPPNASPQTVSELTRKASQLATSADTCKAFASVAEAEGSPSSGFLGEFKLDKLNPQFRNLVDSLNVNETSQPLRTEDGVIVLMVCSREVEGGRDPVAAAREKIEREILHRRLARMADQHQEKLRRQAFIDIRL
ncbi:MAG: peptidylprolyl isomerase [Rhodospirillales bacterium]